VIADLSINYVERQVLLCGHTVEEWLRDYGIDLVLVPFNAQGEVEEGEVHLPIKATDHLKLVASGSMIAYRLQRSDVVFWLRKPLPLILVVYDATADVAYWLYVQAYFAGRAGRNIRKGSATLTVRIPRNDVLNQQAVQQFVRFRDQVMAQIEGRVRHYV
jgi:hypothetical protein